MLDKLGIPIIQAPMLGAAAESMAIAVSRTGALGSLAVANLNPDKLRRSVAEIRAATPRPFAINTFIQPPVDPAPEIVRAAMELLAPWRERFGLPPQSIPNQWAEPFEPQFAAILDCGPPAASFTFGILTSEQTAALRSRGIFIVGTATTVGEAKAWAEVGSDAICAQGFEAGGHRGSFLKTVPESSIGTLSLVRTIVAAVDLPVIAAGGISDGAGVAAALMLGAAAAQIGTAYLLSNESIISAPWRGAIEAAPDDPTRLTRAISGRFARGIENEFMSAMRRVENEVAAYPVQNALTQELRAAAAKAGSTAPLSLWAGQGVKLARPGGAADITLRLWAEALDAMRNRTKVWLGPDAQKGDRLS